MWYVDITKFTYIYNFRPWDVLLQKIRQNVTWMPISFLTIVQREYPAYLYIRNILPLQFVSVMCRV